MQAKKIILGICGGIAAYKSPALVRRLVDHGAEVQVVMTASACEFVRPLVFQAVSGNKVHVELLDEAAEAGMGHIELARWADLILIAPATANTIARLAGGFADDLLSTLCLASSAPVAMAPALNTFMWEHAATRANVTCLQQRGVMFLGPGIGSQACGETGAGRMIEPDDIVDQLQADDIAFSPAGRIDHSVSSLLHDTPVLITAGPTREAIDPVRFLSNRSSGKMGYAIAAAANAAGARVTLVSGPVNLDAPSGVTTIDVSSAVDMQREVVSRVSSDGIFISVAAVADYRIEEQQQQKIKKSDAKLTLTLVRNPDILATVSTAENRPFCVGFAAETENLEQHARSKLEKKNLDMIVANLVGDGLTFGKDQNSVEVFWRDGGAKSFALQSKRTLADELIVLIADQYHKAAVANE